MVPGSAQLIESVESAQFYHQPRKRDSLGADAEISSLAAGLQRCIEDLRLRYPDVLLAIGLTGSVARTRRIERGEIDVLAVVYGWGSQRIRYAVDGVHVDVFVEGYEALQRDVLTHESPLHVNLLADCAPIVDAHSVMAQLRKAAIQAKSAPRKADATMRELFEPSDLYRKLLHVGGEDSEFTYVAALFVQSCITTLFVRRKWWRVGGAGMLAAIEELDMTAHASATMILDSTLPRKQRLQAALDLLERSIGRCGSDHLEHVSPQQFRYADVGLR